MRLIDLAALYLIAGAACAIALYRRSPERSTSRMLNALAAVPLWPLWAPIAWTARHDAASAPPSEDHLQLLRTTLDGIAKCVVETPLSHVLNRETTKSILNQAERVAMRKTELVRLLAREEFQLSKAQAELETLERRHASTRVQTSARLHLENVRRLHHIAARDERALEELLSLVTALRTEVVVVLLSGSSAERVDDIASDLWAHLEGVRQANGVSANA